MKHLLPLSASEWRLLSCLWDLRSANPAQVADHLQLRLREALSPKTVGIMLARLENKGYLRSAPGPVLRGRPPHIYVPLVNREDALRIQIQKFLIDHLIDDNSDEISKKFLETLRASQISPS